MSTCNIFMLTYDFFMLKCNMIMLTLVLYVDMQHTKVNTRLLYVNNQHYHVNNQHNHVNIQVLYVNNQHTKVNIRLLYVNNQHNHVNIRILYVNMRHNYANIRLIYVNMQRHILVFEKWMVNLTCIPFTKGFFVPSLVKIGPVLAHLSWKLKWAFLIACSQSIQQFTFSSSSQDENWTTEPISNKLGTEHPMVNDYDLYQGGGGG